MRQSLLKSVLFILAILIAVSSVHAQTVQHHYIDGAGAGTGTVGDPWNDCAEAIAEEGTKDLVTNNIQWVLHYVDGNYTDTTACTFTNSWTTDATRNIVIVADFYHGGAWDEDKPILAGTTKGGLEFLDGVDADLYGLQVQLAGTASGCRAINIFEDSTPTGASNYHIEGLLIKGSATCTSPVGLRITHSSGGANTTVFRNSVIYNGFFYGMEINPAASSSITIDHIVSHGCDDNNCRNLQYTANGTGDSITVRNSFFDTPSGTGSVDINSSVAFATETYTAVFCSDTSTECTSTSQNPTWTDTANGDFHLDASSDGENAGTDLTGTVDCDIDEASDWLSCTSVRSATPDVGPDERAAAGGSQVLFINAIGEN